MNRRFFKVCSRTKPLDPYWLRKTCVKSCSCTNVHLLYLWVIKTYVWVIDLPELSKNHESMSSCECLVTCFVACVVVVHDRPDIPELATCGLVGTCLNMLHHSVWVCLCNMLLHLSIHMYTVYICILIYIHYILSYSKTYGRITRAAMHLSLCRLVCVCVCVYCSGQILLLHWSSRFISCPSASYPCLGLHWWMETTSCSPIEIPSASGH